MPILASWENNNLKLIPTLIPTLSPPKSDADSVIKFKNVLDKIINE